MATKEQLQTLSAKQLNARLDELSEKTGEKLPKNGSNEDKIERILTAQERLALNNPDDSDSADQGDSSNDRPVSPGMGGIPPSAWSATGETSGSGAETKGSGSKAQTEKNVRVNAVSENGFYRCGLFFPHEGIEVELTDEQLARIKADPNLVIQD